MISRISLSAALVAAANAQYVKLNTVKNMGNSANMGGSCTASFTDANGNAAGSAWVALATINASTDNTVLARGTDLCASGLATSDDYMMDYKIGFSSDTTLMSVEDTGLGLTCPNGTADDKQLESDLKDQIGSNSVAKAVGTLKTVLTSGAVTFLSNTQAEQETYAASAQLIVDNLQTDNDTIIDNMSSDLTTLISSAVTAITVTAKTAWDSYLTTACAAMKTDVTTVMASKVTIWSTIQADTETALDLVVAGCGTEVEKVWTGLTTDVTAVQTTSATTLAATVSSLKTVTADQKTSLTSTVTGSILTDKILSKTLYKETKKAQSANTKGLKDLQTDAKTVGKDTTKAVKDAFKTSSSVPTATTTAMDALIDAAETTITTLLASDSGKSKALKELAKQHKVVKTVLKSQGKEASKATKTAVKAVTDGAKTALKDEKTASKTYTTGL